MGRIRSGVAVLGLALGMMAIPGGWAQDKPSQGPPPLPGQKVGNPSPQQQKPAKPAAPVPEQKAAGGNSADQEAAAVAVEIVNSIPPEDRRNLKGYWPGVESKVGQRWQRTSAAKMGGADAVKITGWIHTDGRVTGLAVEHGSGNASVDRAARGAISGSAPYEPFPYGIAVEQVKVRFTFGSAAPGTPGAAPVTPLH